VIFQHLNAERLGRAFAPHMDRPAWPGLDDTTVKDRARRVLQSSGEWDALAKKLAVGEPIPLLRYADFQEYHRTGERAKYAALFNQRVERTHQAALALWLEHPAASLDELQDLLWGWCESRWAFPAHDSMRIELMSSSIGVLLAEYAWLFRQQLEAPVIQRINRELDERMLNVALDWRQQYWWNTAPTNWNLVCNANLIQIGLYQIHDPYYLASYIHPLARRMDYAIDYFTADGGCVEGMGYWEYGFGHFVKTALVIHHRTGGAINLLEDEHIRRICQFPSAIQIKGEQRAMFCDSTSGYLQPQTALMVNRLLPMPRLFELLEPTSDGVPKMNDVRTLSLYESQTTKPFVDRSDAFLPDLGYTRLYAGHDVAVTAVAGRNDVAHNHNDIGTFTMLIGTTPVIADPGAPVYNAKTFGPNRYDMLFCRTRGHSLPLINGHEQAAGSQYTGTIAVSGLNGSDEKIVTMDLSRAYPDPTLKRFIRTLHLSPAGILRVTDELTFDSKPASIEEAFITFEPVVFASDHATATLGQGDAQLHLKASVEGKFSLEEIPPAQHEGRDPRPLRRVIFTPRQINPTTRLEFQLTPVHEQEGQE
jgi:hypothetical protein